MNNKKQIELDCKIQSFKCIYMYDITFLSIKNCAIDEMRLTLSPIG